MNKPLFSIIIPTYNHAHLIKRCLDSIVSQTFESWEAIVVNNFSQDNTIDVVTSYSDPRIRLVNNANDGIIAVSRNKGIAESNGDWICFLDSDDWWTPNKLETCIPLLESYDYLYHDMEIVYEKSNKRKSLRGRSLDILDPYTDMLLRGNPCINSSAIVRRSVVEKCGLIDENPALIAVEDFDYWLRIVEQTKRVKHIPKILGYYWIGATSISFNAQHLVRIDNLYAKHLLHTPSPKLKSEILKRVAYRQGRIAQLQGDKKLAIRKFKQSLVCHDLYTILRSILFITLIKIKHG